jgi:hypothetical protein
MAGRVGVLFFDTDKRGGIWTAATGGCIWISLPILFMDITLPLKNGLGGGGIETRFF